MNNVIYKVKQFTGKVNPYYDMRIDELDQIYKFSRNDMCECICNAFTFGYIQGMKAAKAEIKKAGAKK